MQSNKLISYNNIKERKTFIRALTTQHVFSVFMISTRSKIKPIFNIRQQVSDERRIRVHNFQLFKLFFIVGN